MTREYLLDLLVIASAVYAVSVAVRALLTFI
jgi:hypothetical protein